MADPQRSGCIERDIDQPITTLKKGAYLLKYGRRGKPKFCHFHLSNVWPPLAISLSLMMKERKGKIKKKKETEAV
ncbi:hypothetical protein REPUB_Repub01dG0081300 [Reevesia pubescens]